MESGSRQNEWVPLFFLLILNLVLRLPVNSHQYGTTDSFFIFGEAKWILSPFSFAGLYPLSYSSMAPFFFSGISIYSNIAIEKSVIVANIFLSILGSFSVYLFTKKLMNNIYVPLFSAFAFSISPIFLFYTCWASTARGVFISILPFLLLLLIRSIHDFKHVLLSVVVMLLIVTIHRAFYFLIIPIIVYCLLILIQKSFGTLYFKGNLLGPRYSLKYYYFGALFLLLLLQYPLISDIYSEGVLSPSNNFFLKFVFSLLNLYISFFGRMGLLFLFAVPGIYYMLEREINLELFFILVTFLLSLPFITERQYIPIFLSPFLSVFIGYGFFETCKRILSLISIEKKNIYLEFAFNLLFSIYIYEKVLCIFKKDKNKSLFIYLFISTILVSSVASSIYINSQHLLAETNKPMSEEVYSSSQFVTKYINCTLISNNGVIGSQVQAISCRPVLPSNIQLWYSPDQLIYNFENKDNLTVDLLQLRDLIPPPDVWFSFSGVSNLKDDYQNIMYFELSSPSVQNTLRKYNIEYVIADKNILNYFVSYGTRNSKFLPSVVMNENKIYDSTKISIYYLYI